MLCRRACNDRRDRGRVIGILPVLNINDALINEGMDILENCLQELV
jgi:4-aminobutyrate aminotransferase-like enzyme